MFGNAARNRVKQTAVVVSDTAFTLTGGTAETGFRTFYSAFVGALTAPSGNYSWFEVPVLVTQGAAWQIMTAQFDGDTSGSTAALSSGVVHETSTGSALSLSVGSTVTVEIVPIARMFGYLALGPMAFDEYSVPDPTGPGAQFSTPLVTSPGAMAAGRCARASGTQGIALGYRANAAAAYSVSIGTRAGPYQVGGIALVNSWHGEILTATKYFFAAPETICVSALTANATPTPLGFYNDGSLASGGDEFYCDAGVTVLECTVVAASASDRKVWKYTACVFTDPDYTSSAIVGTPVKTELYESGGATAWDINLVQDVDQTFKLEGTGAAATDITWSATVVRHLHYLSDN